MLQIFGASMVPTLQEGQIVVSVKAKNLEPGDIVAFYYGNKVLVKRYIAGHRGLPSARLFTDLDKMAVGDIFMLHVLDETLTYEVDQIRIVEPHETQELMIQQGKDLCTLFTCTSYGINSHRLLVRGHRIENIEEAQIVRVMADAVIVEKLVVAPFVLAPILLMMLIVLLIQTRKKRRRNVK